MKEKLAQTPIKAHRYEGKTYLTLDGVEEILKDIREEIEKELLTDTEIRFSCLGEGLYWAGEQDTRATASPPFLMPRFERVVQAQLDKVLKVLES